MNLAFHSITSLVLEPVKTLKVDDHPDFSSRQLTVAWTDHTGATRKQAIVLFADTAGPLRIDRENENTKYPD